MITDIQKEKVLSIAKELGFSGMRKDRAIVNGKAVPASRLLKTLGLQEKLWASEDLDLVRIFSKWDAEKDGLLASLTSQKIESSNQVPKIGLAGFLPNNYAQFESFVLNNLFLVKTLRVDGMEQYCGPVRNGSTPIMAINTLTNSLMKGSEISIDGILQLKGIDRKDVLSDKTVPYVWPVFNPLSTEMTYTDSVPTIGESHLILNTYPCPAWRLASAAPKYQGFVKKLFENVFPIEAERDYVLQWVRQAIVGRNNTVLVMVGDRGVGKSLVNTLISALVGVEHSEVLRKEALTEKFNKQVFNTRFATFEETGMGADGDDQSAIENMKAMTNERLKIEGKGENPFSAKNWCSFSMSLNSSSELNIRPQERRFSIPKIGTEDLKEVVSELNIAKRYSAWGQVKIEDESLARELAEFGEYLLAMDPKDWSDSVPLRGEYYYQVTMRYLKDWENAIIELLIRDGEAGEPIEIKKLTKYLSHVPPNGFRIRSETVANFLSDYRHFNQCKLGVIDRRWREDKTRAGRIIPDANFISLFGKKVVDPDKGKTMSEIINEDSPEMLL